MVVEDKCLILDVDGTLCEIKGRDQAYSDVEPIPDMLAEIMRPRFSIAVGGAHGKTTTASMIAVMLAHAGLDPTALIGARVPAFGSNAIPR